MEPDDFGMPSKEQLGAVDEMTVDAPTSDTVTLPTPETMKDAKAGDPVALQGEVVDNVDGQLTVKVISAK